MPIKPILADFDLSGLPEVLESTNKRTAQNEQRSYRRTVENWDNKPEFFLEAYMSHYGGLNDYKVYTDSLIYLWVDEGTDPHTITPNGDYPLNVRGFGNTIFNGGQAYYPKSSKDKIVSSGAGEYEPDDIPLWSVRQSIEPRNFTVNILSKAKERWGRAIETEIKKYLEKNVK